MIPAKEKRKLKAVAAALEQTSDETKQGAAGLGGTGTAYAAQRLEVERKEELRENALLSSKGSKRPKNGEHGYGASEP